jgi:hypothetical protein
MKRMIVGMLCALVAWMIGTQINFWWAKWLGLVVGFVSGLALEDWKATKVILAEKWRYYRCEYKWDWKGALTYMGTSFCFAVSIVSWCFFISYIVTLPASNHEIGATLQFPMWETFFVTLFLWFIIPISNHGAINIRQLSPDVAGFWTKMESWWKWNPISVFCFWLPYTVIRYIIPFLLECKVGIPEAVRVVGHGLKRFSQFLLYSLIELMAREKTLTFAICVTVGAGIGMLLGKTVVCGLSAAASAGVLIVVSDLTREIAKQKLEILRQGT